MEDIRQWIGSQASPQCESPIEMLLLSALYYEAGSELIGRFASMSVRQPVLPLFKIRPQHPIGPYRVDIAVIGEHVRVVVECDGHEFHERTKEQAAKDKSRDRYLTAEEWLVLRFTGSEIHRNPLACAYEVVRLIEGSGPPPSIEFWSEGNAVEDEANNG